MKDRGFSLIELVLSIAGGAAIALTVVLLVEPFNNLMFTVWRRSGVSEAQVAMTRMLREIERVKSPADITAFTSTHLAFVDISDQVVDFSLSGTDLMRNGDVLARSVQSLSFVFMDKDGAVTATADSIRLVRITLTISAGGRSVSLRSAAAIRNGVT